MSASQSIDLDAVKTMRHQGLQHGITGVEYIRHLMRSKARGVITAQEGRQRFVTAGRE